MNTLSIQLSIEKLERILSEAKLLKHHDSSLSNTVQLTLIKENDTHNGSDVVEAYLKSSYSECDSKSIRY